MGLTDNLKKVVLREKNPPASAGDARDPGSVSGEEDPLGKEMAPHSGVLAWKAPWTGRARRAIVHGVAKWSGMTELLSTLKKNRGIYD